MEVNNHVHSLLLNYFTALFHSRVFAIVYYEMGQLKYIHITGADSYKLSQKWITMNKVFNWFISLLNSKVETLPQSIIKRGNFTFPLLGTPQPTPLTYDKSTFFPKFIQLCLTQNIKNEEMSLGLKEATPLHFWSSTPWAHPTKRKREREREKKK